MRIPSLRRSVLALVVLSLLAAACGGSDDSTTPTTSATATSAASDGPGFPEGAIAVRASADLGVGQERLLVGVVLPDGTQLARPDIPVTFEVAPLVEGAEPLRVQAGFSWIVPEAVGLYRATVTFDRSGPWQVTVVGPDGKALDPALFNVSEHSLTPAIGEPAPVVDTPTLDDLPIEGLTTDPDPDPRFYEMSLADAIAAGKKIVLVFSTPAYCQTAACGPMLDILQEQVIDRYYPDVAFIHVEVYTDLQDPDFAPDADHLAPAVVEWRLPSEPWVFVIDESGTVVGRFEGVLSPEELEPYLS